jgi:hypothetical protein
LRNYGRTVDETWSDERQLFGVVGMLPSSPRWLPTRKNMPNQYTIGSASNRKIAEFYL